MAEPKVMCLVCKELKRHWMVFTSEEALKHQKKTGHGRWELLGEGEIDARENSERND